MLEFIVMQMRKASREKGYWAKISLIHAEMGQVFGEIKKLTEQAFFLFDL